MKPIYLEFGGLNSFEEKARIDFTKLLSGGLFGIFGDTGSGKSTILDSIHFALYGVIDRAARSFNDCINHRAEKVSVTFVFEILTEGVRRTYRVYREHGRKASQTKARLDEMLVDGSALALAEGTKDVNPLIEKIIGLNFEDFKTCIALPQGDFAALVKSTTAHRIALVARLFGLEKYGDRLAEVVRERTATARTAVSLLQARMEENEGGDEELYAKTLAEIALLQEETSNANRAAEEAETRFQTLAEMQKEKQAFERLQTRLLGMETRLENMQAKRALLEVYPKALAVKEKTDERDRAIAQKTHAQTRAENAKRAHERAMEGQKKAAEYLSTQDFEKRILALSLQLQKAKESAADRAHAERTQKEYDACVAEYRKLNKECVAEDFDGLRAALEEKLVALGEDQNVLEYLKRNYKGVLTADTYAEIRHDLALLTEKYPQIEGDVAPLFRKYALPVNGSQSVDIAQVQLAFREVERERKRLQTEIEGLEKRRSCFERKEAEKALVAKQGALLRQTLALAQEKLSGLQGLESEETLVEKIDNLKDLQSTAKSAEEKARADLSAAYAEEKTQRELFALYAQTENELAQAVVTLLQTHGFADEAQAVNALRETGDPTRLQEECKSFFEEYELCKRQLAETDESKFAAFDAGAFVVAEETRKMCKTQAEERAKALHVKEAERDRLEIQRAKFADLRKELSEKNKRLQTCEELSQLLRGNKFLEFIASEYLQEVCLGASKTLLSLTGGRYFLQYDKEFKVGDNRDGGNLRAVKTLSGGETFLVSLSLALSLSASICQKSRRPIEFFFLDEGFGTLDEKLVETVMDVLGKLSKTFSVGLISHVEELKRRIENKILVSGATECKGSTLKVEAYG